MAQSTTHCKPKKWKDCICLWCECKKKQFRMLQKKISRKIAWGIVKVDTTVVKFSYKFKSHQTLGRWFDLFDWNIWNTQNIWKWERFCLSNFKIYLNPNSKLNKFKTFLMYTNPFSTSTFFLVLNHPPTQHFQNSWKFNFWNFIRSKICVFCVFPYINSSQHLMIFFDLCTHF